MQVVLGGVKDFLLRRALEKRLERSEVCQPQRIDDVVGVERGELNEAHPLAVGVKAVGLRVDGDEGIPAQIAHEPIETGLVFDQDWGRQRSNGHAQPIIGANRSW